MIIWFTEEHEQEHGDFVFPIFQKETTENLPLVVTSKDKSSASMSCSSWLGAPCTLSTEATMVDIIFIQCTNLTQI
jgi:hypothetical protein